MIIIQKCRCGIRTPRLKMIGLQEASVVTWKVGEYWETNGYVNHQNLNHNPKSSKEAGQWTDCKDLNDSGEFWSASNPAYRPQGITITILRTVKKLIFIIETSVI